MEVRGNNTFIESQLAPRSGRQGYVPSTQSASVSTAAPPSTDVNQPGQQGTEQDERQAQRKRVWSRIAPKLLIKDFAEPKALSGPMAAPLPVSRNSPSTTVMPGARSSNKTPLAIRHGWIQYSNVKMTVASAKPSAIPMKLATPPPRLKPGLM